MSGGMDEPRATLAAIHPINSSILRRADQTNHFRTQFKSFTALCQTQSLVVACRQLDELGRSARLRALAFMGRPLKWPGHETDLGIGIVQTSPEYIRCFDRKTCPDEMTVWTPRQDSFKSRQPS